MRFLPILALACAPAADPESLPDCPGPDPLAWDITQPGPYQVGFRDVELTYEPVAGTSRTNTVSIWYPTDDTEGPSVSYSGQVPGNGELGDATPAPPAHDCAYPVLAYSHGDRGFGATSHDLMRWFASHGWVAIAPDHTDNLLWADVEPDPQSQWYDRPLDISAALDHLESLPAEDPLSQADTSNVLIAGHSRGASTVWSLAGASFDGDATGYCPDCSAEQLATFNTMADPRASAFMLLAGIRRGSLFGETGYQAVDAPVMLITGSEDDVGQQDFFDNAGSLDLSWVDLLGGCHQTPALGLCGTLEPALGYQIVDSYALAFARHHILGDTAQAVDILTGTAQVNAEVATLSRSANATP